MTSTCETVEIVSKDAPDGFIVFNKSDMTDKDVLYKPKKKDKKDSK